MDPQAAWREIVDFLKRRAEPGARAVNEHLGRRGDVYDAGAESVDAAAIAEGLMHWLAKGRFPPLITGNEDVDRFIAKQVCWPLMNYGREMCKACYGTGLEREEEAPELRRDW